MLEKKAYPSQLINLLFYFYFDRYRSNLISIRSKAEMDWLRSYAAGQRVWIGKLLSRGGALPLKSHMGKFRLQDPPFHTDF